MSRLVLLRLLEAYFRHRWLHLVPVVLMLAAGLYYVSTKPLEFISRGLVYVPGEPYLVRLTDIRTSEGNWWISPSQSTSNEIRDLLRSEAFVRTVLARTDLASQVTGIPWADETLIEDTREAVWAVPEGDNQVVVGAVHKNPLLAQQLALATIDSYTQWRIDQELAASGGAQSFLDGLIATYKADVDTQRAALTNYLIENPRPFQEDRPEVVQIEIDRLAAELAQAQERYATALSQEESARLAASQAEVSVRQSFYVVDSPPLPHKAELSRRQLALELAIFMSVGGLLALAAVVGRAILDRSLLFPLDVRETLGLSVLATVPDLGRPGRRARRQRPAPQLPAESALPAEAEPEPRHNHLRQPACPDADRPLVPVFAAPADPSREQDTGN